MAGERKASDPRCVHGSWQGTYCPDCPANRAVFGAQRFLPSLTPPGERPERDVLAEAIEKVAVLPKWDKRTVPGGFHVKRSDVLSIIDAARATLSKSAPDRHVVTLADSEPDHDDASDWFGPQEPSALAMDLRAARELAERILSRPSSRKPSEVRLAQVVLAQPIPEPLPREALAEVLATIRLQMDGPYITLLNRDAAAILSALSPDRPTPP